MNLLPPNLSQSTRFELHVSYSKIPLAIYFKQKFHGWRSLEGCSPRGRWGSDTIARLHFHFSFSCIGEGNGNPLQCSCLENPRDGGARWAAIYGVAQSQTWLKQLSSSSNSIHVSMLLFPFISLSSLPTVSKVCSVHLCLHSCPANRFVSMNHLSRFYMYVLIHNICFSLSDLLHCA